MIHGKEGEMLLTVIFLISCIITARILDKYKMHVASVGYSVMFIILFFALLFTVDIEPIRIAFSNVMGEAPYLEVKEALLYALRSPGFGTCIVIALLLTAFLQIAVSVIFAVTAIISLLKKGKKIYFIKKDEHSCSCLMRALYINRSINLLYCRMLN